MPNVSAARLSTAEFSRGEVDGDNADGIRIPDPTQRCH